MRAPLPHHVVVVGLMASGKTTVGAAIATELGVRLDDSDVWIESSTGMTGAQVAEQRGVPVLHALEAEHVLTALAAADPSVISAAASIADDPICLDALSDAHVVWLDIAPAILAERVAAGRHRRHLAAYGETLAQQRDRRAGAYARVADQRETGARPPAEVARRAARSIRRRSDAPPP